MKVGTWNVNGIRARHAQVLDWIDRERPDVVCLQEIKASSDQVPALLWGLDGYWSYWHGGGGYSGVALHVRQTFCELRPAFTHPEFDHEHRIVTADIGGITFASVYVPNGGKDFPAKIRFLQALIAWARGIAARSGRLVLSGDLNVAHTDRDVHPKERKPRAIGQLPEERALIDALLQTGLVDIGRTLDPHNNDLFTWWAPWRNLRQRNIGWRLDYVLASPPVARLAQSCRVQPDVGTSDHGPVVAVFDAAQ